MSRHRDVFGNIIERERVTEPQRYAQEVAEAAAACDRSYFLGPGMPAPQQIDDGSNIFPGPTPEPPEIDEHERQFYVTSDEQRGGFSSMGPNMHEYNGAWEARPPNPKQIYGDAKVPLHLVPSAGVIQEAMAFKEGARKYGPYNWRLNAVEAMTYIGAALRHIYTYLDGEDLDPEVEERTHHLGEARASLGILLDALATGNLIDNRPQRGSAMHLLASLKQECGQ